MALKAWGRRCNRVQVDKLGPLHSSPALAGSWNRERWCVCHVPSIPSGEGTATLSTSTVRADLAEVRLPREVHL